MARVEIQVYQDSIAQQQQGLPPTLQKKQGQLSSCPSKGHERGREGPDL